MRLIDADALPRHGDRGGLVHWKDIQSAPTIEPDWTELMVICDKCGHAIHVKRTDAKPTIEPPRWIPVSERLPDRDGRYLVTCSKVGAWVVDWNIWHCEPKPSWLWEQGVTAWMPMPEPYKEPTP